MTVSPITEHDIDDLIIKIKKNENTNSTHVSEFEHIKPYRKVIAEYLAKNSPPYYSWAEEKGYSFLFNDALNATINLTRHLSIVKTRIEASTLPNYDISWEKNLIRERTHWKAKQKKLEELLQEAANLFKSGQCHEDNYPTLTSYKEKEALEYQSVDEILWCGAENLSRWAKIISKSPVEVVFPITRSPLSGFNFNLDNIGKRGGASDPDGALRAFMIREIAEYIPNSMTERYSVIHKLVSHVGIQTNRHYVRSLLMKGKT